MCQNTVYVFARPESLYKSLVKIDFYLTCSNGSTVKVWGLTNDIVKLDVNGCKVQIKEKNESFLKITHKTPNCNFTLWVRGLIEDSDDLMDPLISSRLTLDFTVEPAHSLTVGINFPERTHGYFNSINAKSSGKALKEGHNNYISSENNNGSDFFDHLTKGFDKGDIVYLFSNIEEIIDEPSEKLNFNFTVDFKPTFIEAGSLLVPFLLGLPVLIAIGLTDAKFWSQFSLILSLVPIIYAIWYNTANKGMRRFISFINFVYITFLALWISYIILFSKFPFKWYLLTPYLTFVFYITIIIVEFQYNSIQSYEKCRKRRGLSILYLTVIIYKTIARKISRKIEQIVSLYGRGE